MTARMPCGVTVALRQYEAEQDRNDGLWQQHADGIAQYWTDNVMEGGCAYGKHWRLQDFLENMDQDELAALIGSTGRDEIIEKHTDIQAKLARHIKSFFLTFCEDEIWAVITERSEG